MLGPGAQRPSTGCAPSRLVDGEPRLRVFAPDRCICARIGCACRRCIRQKKRSGLATAPFYWTARARAQALLRRRDQPRPASASPMRPSVAGSGTTRSFSASGPIAKSLGKANAAVRSNLILPMSAVVSRAPMKIAEPSSLALLVPFSVKVPRTLPRVS